LRIREIGTECVFVSVCVLERERKRERERERVIIVADKMGVFGYRGVKVGVSAKLKKRISKISTDVVYFNLLYNCSEPR
jgi:hypothetical protein